MTSPKAYITRSTLAVTCSESCTGLGVAVTTTSFNTSTGTSFNTSFSTMTGSDGADVPQATATNDRIAKTPKTHGKDI